MTILESQLQFASAVLFHGSLSKPPALRSDWRAWHTPNGEHRDAITGAKLKRMGVLPGVPDWILVAPGGFLHFLELKRIGATLSLVQRDFANWAFANGIPYKIAHTRGEVIMIAQKWDALDPSIKII